MNSLQPPPEDAALTALLRSWRVDAAAAPRFAEDVWRRIERRSNSRPQPLATVLAVRLIDILRQPRIALAYFAVLVLLGTGAGILQGHVATRHLAQGLQGRYVQSIDPFATHVH